MNRHRWWLLAAHFGSSVMMLAGAFTHDVPYAIVGAAFYLGAVVNASDETRR